MIDNNIIQSIGAGSGIDTKNLVTQLTQIERSAPQARIDTKRDTTETQISDFGLMSSALATLKDAATVLTDPEGMFSKTASFTDSDALVPVELGTDVQAGSYTFTVEDIAQSQSLTSTEFSDPDDAVGEGTLTFSIGNADVTAGAITGFTQDQDVDTVDIVIDSTNNSLEGLRDAINDADFGVQASIVFNGTGYVLQLNAESGANNELEISVSESGASPTNDDDAGLSRFSFIAGASQLTQNQGGQDAELTINGLTVFRESNSIEDIVQGLKLDVLKADPGTPINITVSDDKVYAEQSVRDFIEAYNLFLEAVEPAVGIYEEEDEEGDKQTIVGSLANDALAKSVISQIRSVIASAIPGLEGSSFTSLGAMGILTELDGSMSIDEEVFSDAFENNFEDIQKLFAPSLSTSDNSIYINSYNSNTQAGEYEVVIDTPPSRGEYNGAAPALDVASEFPNYDSSLSTYTFKISVNGTESETITIPSDTYESIEDFTDAIQTVINADANLSADGAEVIVAYDSDNDRFDITSTRYGAASSVNIIEASDHSITNLGFAEVDGTVGTTVAGTVNGVSGFGSSNVLLPNLNEPGAGLALVVGDGASSATVNFSRGFAGELEALLDEFLASNGLIAARETNLETSLDELEDDQEALDRRMTSYEERLIQQFINMERILNSLNTSGSFIENLINTLPFTSSNKD